MRVWAKIWLTVVLVAMTVRTVGANMSFDDGGVGGRSWVHATGWLIAGASAVIVVWL